MNARGLLSPLLSALFKREFRDNSKQSFGDRWKSSPEDYRFIFRTEDVHFLRMPNWPQTDSSYGW